MKLGLIGIIRFCCNSLYYLNIFLAFIFFFAILFFFKANSELDNKRWLAFLSLSHILVPLIGLNNSCLGGEQVKMLFCLGHGLSAAMLFYYFLCIYSVCGTRNWVLICLSKNVNIKWRVLSVLCLISVASFPPSIKFLTEISIMGNCTVNNLIIFIFCSYLFLGGLIPVILIRFLLTKRNRFGSGVKYFYRGFILLASIFAMWIGWGFWL